MKLYRIDCSDIGEENRAAAVGGIKGYAASIGTDVIPDTRLQAIADAWNLFVSTQWKADIRTFNPELGNLLDALGEEDNDEAS